MQHRDGSDPHARVRHLLRNQLAAISGWMQLLAREHARPDPDPARLAELSTRFKADVARMSVTIDGELGADDAAQPGNGIDHTTS